MIRRHADDFVSWAWLPPNIPALKIAKCDSRVDIRIARLLRISHRLTSLPRRKRLGAGLRTNIARADRYLGQRSTGARLVFLSPIVAVPCGLLGILAGSAVAYATSLHPTGCRSLDRASFEQCCPSLCRLRRRLTHDPATRTRRSSQMRHGDRTGAASETRSHRGRDPRGHRDSGGR